MWRVICVISHQESAGMLHPTTIQLLTHFAMAVMAIRAGVGGPCLSSNRALLKHNTSRYDIRQVV